jgi:hypothetical protein
VLARHISEGQCHKVRDSLPKGLRQMWDGGAESHAHEEARARHDERHEAKRGEEERKDEPLILTEAQTI